MRTTASLFAILLLLVASPAMRAAENDNDAKQGEWVGPPSGQKAWKHEATGLSFPLYLGSYRMTGEFRYKEGGGKFIRYASVEDRARADIFFFPHTTAKLSEDDTTGAINNELDSLIANFRQMADAGRYKNVVIDDTLDGAIPVWPKGSLPLRVRSLVATKMADTKDGPKEAQIKQWNGVTMLNGVIITIRYVHPTDTGGKGEEALKAFIGVIFQIIKDPALRADIKVLVQAYLADPMSEEGEKSASAVLAYIKQTPFVTVPIPVEAISPWLDQFKKIAPGSEMQLLRAFALGSAQVALSDGDLDACLTAGTKQFLLIYDQLVRGNPLLKIPAVEDLRAATVRGTAPALLKSLAAGGK